MNRIRQIASYKCPAGHLAFLLVSSLMAAACSTPPGESEQTTRLTPRLDDGRINLDRVPGEKGYWGPASKSSLVETGVDVEMDERGLLADIGDAGRVAPFQPWALALYEYRQNNGLQDDPVRFCISPAGPRHLHTAGGFRIIQDRHFERAYLVFGGGNRGWRVIYMDARSPPDPEEVAGTYYGHSTGRWEEDVLVVESSGFNARFWFSNGGLPHTEALRLTERFSRPDFHTLKYELTIDDPLTYTRAWNAEWTVVWIEGGEIEQRFCEDNR